MISSHKIPPIAILYIFIGATQQVRHLGKGGGVDKESKKNDKERRRACSQKCDLPRKQQKMTEKGGGYAV